METVIVIEHDTIMGGTFMADKLRQLSSDITVSVEELPRFKEKVTITLMNRDEDMNAAIYYIGKLMGQLETLSRR